MRAYQTLPEGYRQILQIDLQKDKKTALQVNVGGSIAMIHYRSERNDPDVLVKVLLNGNEARLPIETDCAPYYHWDDVKRYYLRKLYRYENMRFNEKVKK